MASTAVNNRNHCKFRKGDEVIVTTGIAKGTTGKIDKIDHKKSKVYVAGVKSIKKHQKPSSAEQEGGIIDKPRPIHISNVAFVDPKTNKASRLGYKIVDGNKIRVSRKSGSEL